MLSLPAPEKVVLSCKCSTVTEARYGDGVLCFAHGWQYVDYVNRTWPSPHRGNWFQRRNRLGDTNGVTLFIYVIPALIYATFLIITTH